MLVFYYPPFGQWILRSGNGILHMYGTPHSTNGHYEFLRMPIFGFEEFSINLSKRDGECFEGPSERSLFSLFPRYRIVHHCRNIVIKILRECNFKIQMDESFRIYNVRN